MLQISTFLQQRSFGYTWLAEAGSHIQIPSGVITGISLTSIKDSKVYVGNISVTDDGLSVVLMQDNKMFASVLTKEESSTVVMERGENCVSAILETGGFMSARFAFVPKTKQYIRRSLLTILDHTEVRIQKLTINGVEYTFEDNIEFSVDSRYLTYTVKDGVLTFKMTDSARAMYNPSESNVIMQDYGMLYSINGVAPNDEGQIHIGVVVSGVQATFDAMTSTCASINSTVNPCESVDLIGQALSPAKLGTSTSRPLDEAFTHMNDGSYSRDYKKLLQGPYGNYEGAESGGVTLFQLNPIHDASGYTPPTLEEN